MQKRLLKCFCIYVWVIYYLCACDMGQTDIKPVVPNSPEEEPKITLTINNASSYDIESVKWNGSQFGIINIGDSKKVEIEPGFGFIYFSFIPQGSDESVMYCYTDEALFIDSQSQVFTFTNNTVVIQQQNSDNKDILEAITLPSEAVLGVSVNNRSVSYGDFIAIENTDIYTQRTITFTMINAGKEKLNFIGNSPVSVVSHEDSASNCFSVIQPQISSLNVNETTTFDIIFSPESIQTYIADVYISSNDNTSPFTFKITVEGVEPIPELTIRYNDQEIPNEGTIDFGEVIIEKNKIVNITIDNTGSRKLTLTGDDPVCFLYETNCFEIISQPIPEISAGSSSVFSVMYVPSKHGEETAVLKITSDDPEKENTYIYLKGTGRKVYPTFVLYKPNSYREVSDGETLPVNIIRKDLSDEITLEVENTSADVDLRFDVALETISDNISVSYGKNVLSPREKGKITVKFNPDGQTGVYNEKIVITSNCLDTVFEFFTNFKSREYSTEANLFNMNIGGVVSPIIVPSIKEYTLTCDSIYDSYTVYPSELEYSANAAVYINDILLKTEVNVPIYDGAVMTIRIISEDGLTENTYTFNLVTRENFDSTELIHLYLKTTADGSEQDIVNAVASGSYYISSSSFYIKPVLKNPNATIYIGDYLASSLDQLQEIVNNEYTPIINLYDYIYSGSVKICIFSESWLEMKTIQIKQIY